MNENVSADELIARHIGARGGLERIMAIETLRQQGRVQMGGMEVRLRVERKRPNLLRVEFTVSEQAGVEGWDGSAAWEFNPWKGMSHPKYVFGAPATALRRAAEFDGPLVGYREKGHTIEYLGREQLGEREAYVLKVTLKDGNVISYYLNAETMFTVKTSTVRPVHGGEGVETETFYEDYRQVEGVFFPFRSREVAKGGEHSDLYEWESIEANVPIENSQFAMPQLQQHEQLGQ